MVHVSWRSSLTCTTNGIRITKRVKKYFYYNDTENSKSVSMRFCVRRLILNRNDRKDYENTGGFCWDTVVNAQMPGREIFRAKRVLLSRVGKAGRIPNISSDCSWFRENTLSHDHEAESSQAPDRDHVPSCLEFLRWMRHALCQIVRVNRPTWIETAADDRSSDRRNTYSDLRGWIQVLHFVPSA